MAAPPRGLAAALAALRETNTAHAAAVDELERAFDSEAAHLADGRRLLEDDRGAFTKKEAAALERDAEILAVAPPLDDVVKLNVGGLRFETSRNVLTKVDDSMLGRMFGRCDTMLQRSPDDGSVFIDRDGERFKMVLDYLRHLDGPLMQRCLAALPEAQQEALISDLDYFGLEKAVFGDAPWTDAAAFRPGPLMRQGRAYFGAVALAGRVYVFGGASDGLASKTTEFLDVAGAMFVAGTDLIAGRNGCCAVVLDGGRVLIVGGTDDEDEQLGSTEVFGVLPVDFSDGPVAIIPRNGCAAVQLDANRCLIVGGDDIESEFASTEVLRLDSMAFEAGPAMATRRTGSCAVALDDHRILVAGGFNSGSENLNSTEVLDLRTMRFSPGPRMRSARGSCAAVSVDEKHVLIIGGQDAFETMLSTTELLDVESMTFSQGPEMTTERHACAAVRYEVGGKPMILVMGGDDEDDEDMNTTELLCVDAQSRADRRRRGV